MARLLIVAFIIGAVFFVGYLAGQVSRRQGTEAKLSRPERRELARLRTLKETVRTTAMDNLELEPNLNRIYLDEVAKAEKETA